MPRWLKALLIVAAVLWAGVVYRPYLVGSDVESRGFLGDDLEVLVVAAGSEGAQVAALQDMDASDYLNAAGPEGSYLGGASLALSRRLWQVSESSATLYRLENLLLLLAIGLGLGQFVRRLLLPWTGLDHARAAARGVPVVMALHPFTVHAVARIGSRPEFLSMALGAWAAAAYLRARQERKPGGILLAGVLALLTYLAGGFGLGLAILLGVAEGVSVQRYQNGKRRCLRGLTTFAVFACIASVELFARRATLGPEGDLALGGYAIERIFERLGILLIPLPTPGVLQVLAVLLFLVAMHPALRAARAAPRLWGWLLFVWGGVLCATLVLKGGEAHVGLGDFTSAARLFPAAIIWCAGLVIVATGVQGFRRLVLPIALAVGLGCLSLAQSGAHTDAVRATYAARVAIENGAREAQELQKALAREGRGTTAGPSVILLRDEAVGGTAPLIDPFGAGVAFYLDRSLVAERFAVRPPLLATPAAFAAFAREPEFNERRRGGLVLVRGDADPSMPPGSSLSAFQRLPAPSPVEVPPLWRGDPQSPELNLDPFNFGAVLTVLDGPPGANELPTRLDFHGRAANDWGGSFEGVWVRSRGRIEGRFDVSSSLVWLLSRRVTRVGFESGLGRLATGHFYPGLDSVNPKSSHPLTFEVVGDDWRIAIPADGAELSPLDQAASDEYVLVLLDLDDLSLRECVASTGTSGSLIFKNARPAPGTGELAWSLERRVNGRVVWRTRGRVQ